MLVLRKFAGKLGLTILVMAGTGRSATAPMQVTEQAVIAASSSPPQSLQPSGINILPAKSVAACALAFVIGIPTEASPRTKARAETNETRWRSRMRMGLR